MSSDCGSNEESPPRMLAAMKTGGSPMKQLNISSSINMHGLDATQESLKLLQESQTTREVSKL